MTSTLQQLNISYHPIEDRLLLRANAGNAGEYRIWLTRRYCGLLLKVLADVMEKEGGIREIASHQDTIKQLKGGAFDQPYEAPVATESNGKPDTARLPFGASGILGYRINANRRPGGVLNLQLLPETGQGLNLDLNRTMLFMLYNLLEQGLTSAEWALYLPQQHKEPVH